MGKLYRSASYTVGFKVYPIIIEGFSKNSTIPYFASY